MRNQVFVQLGNGAEFQFSVDDTLPMAPDVARAWLDAQFVSLDCEPLRASGKVLTVDKVLRVTEAAGASLFADAEWADAFARAVSAALARPVVRVDVPAMAITY